MRFLMLVLLLYSLALAQNRPLAEFAFDTVRGGMTFVAGTLESGERLDFLFDTGGSGNLVDREFAVKLGMKMQPGISSASGAARLDVGVIPEALLIFGPIRHRGSLVAANLAALEPILGRSFKGMLGGEFLRQYVVQLDYDQKRMRLFDPASFQYQENGTAFPLRMAAGIPFVELAVALPNNKRIHGRFLVDTGGGGMAIHIHRQVAVREGLMDGLPTLTETALGIGGETKRRVTRGSTLAMGPFQLSRPVVAFTEDEAGLRTDAGSVGLVGMEVLSRFNVTFDYSRGQMYLKPNRRLNDPFIYDAIGMGLRATGPSFSQLVVSSVRNASPSHMAGIRIGDLLVQVDGQAASSLGLDLIWERLRRADQSHRLTLVRGEQMIQALVRTRDLLE